jgi:uncharacterized protein YgiM (DUF1202 family)
MAMTVAQQPIAPSADAGQRVQQDSAPARSAAVAKPAITTETQPAPLQRSEPQPTTNQPIPVAANVSRTPPAPAVTTTADTVRPMPGDEGIARNWVNVRAGTGRDSDILGVIKPDARVRFGNTRGGWIQVRTPDLWGWADRRLFSVVR